MKRLYLAGVAVALATVVAIVVAVVAFSGGGGAGAGDTSATATDGTSEGISVHGHWVIEVREPDGALVSRNEFDNVLEEGGALTLAMLLIRQKSMNLWEVGIFGPSNPCRSDTGAETGCLFLEPNSTVPPAPYRFYNLTATRSGGEVQLSGNATPQADGNIDLVKTYTALCPPSVPPGGCPDTEYFIFSTKSLPSPIDVLAGQQILVTVTFTFS